MSHWRGDFTLGETPSPDGITDVNLTPDGGVVKRYFLTHRVSGVQEEVGTVTVVHGP